MPNNIRSVSFLHRVPKDYQGMYTFKYTVAKTYKIYWTNLELTMERKIEESLEDNQL